MPNEDTERSLEKAEKLIAAYQACFRDLTSYLRQTATELKARADSTEDKNPSKEDVAVASVLNGLVDVLAKGADEIARVRDE